MDGGPWAYCDLNGSDVGGFSKDDLGVLHVTPTAEIGVSWCKLEAPAKITVDPGQETPAVTGLFYGAGVTVGTGQGAGSSAKLHRPGDGAP